VVLLIAFPGVGQKNYKRKLNQWKDSIRNDDGRLRGAGRFLSVGLVTWQTEPQVFVLPTEVTIASPIAVGYRF
jgi:hypothetical protein